MSWLTLFGGHGFRLFVTIHRPPKQIITKRKPTRISFKFSPISIISPPALHWLQKRKGSFLGSPIWLSFCYFFVDTVTRVYDTFKRLMIVVSQPPNSHTSIHLVDLHIRSIAVCILREVL